MHRNRVIGFFADCILPVVALLAAGCGDDGPAPQGTLPPKVGSYWTFDRWFLDSNRQAGERDVMTPTVFAIDASYEGETALFRLEDGLDGNSYSIYLRYEPNGDLRILHSFYYPLFITLPTGSKLDSVPLPVYDSNFTENGVYYALHFEGVVRYVGGEVLTVDGQELATEHVVIDADATTTIGVSTSDQTITADLWYAPSIGYFVKAETWIEEPPLFGYSLDRGDRRALTRWSLK